MQETCKIQWIDSSGKPTPDTNPAVGHCWMVARKVPIGGRVVALDEGERFPICAEHLRQLSEPGMGFWMYEPLDAMQKPWASRYSRALRIAQAMARNYHKPHLLCQDSRGETLEFISFPWVSDDREPRILVNVRVPGDCTTMRTVRAEAMDPKGIRCSCKE
jgi:hypothetical protein